MASHFHFLFFLLLLLTTTTTVTAQDNNHQLNLLISFKNSLPNPSLLPSWSSSSSPCNFHGVSCSPLGLIQSIQLQDLPLSSPFPSSLLSIPSLLSLSLRSLNLSGPLPTSLNCSSNLSLLDISSNSLSSSLPNLFLLASSCSSLRTLNFSRNLITPDIDSTLSSSPPPRFEFLDLSYTNISSEESLRWLLSGGVVLGGLDLSGNNFSGSKVPAISNCSELQHLDLSGTGLAGVIESGVFGACAKLEYLNISGNHFVGSLPSDLSFCTAMKEISVSSNNFSGEFPAGVLASMPQLRVAEFAFNNFSGVLGDSVSELRMLEVLDLSSNSLSGTIPATICPVPNHPLKELYLQNNRISGAIPESLSNCTNLVSLDLSLNFITGAIPASLGLLSELQDLIMWQNFLDGEIPPEISGMKKLENLILDSNGLSGSIPDQLSSCSNLKWLSLSSNLLSGHIPSWIGKLKNLAILKLANNSFSGPIPAEIGDCKSLIWLDLNNNQLNGSIPGELAKQSGNIAAGLVTGKQFVYLRNDGSSACRGSGSLLEFGGIRPEDLNRLSSSKFCNFTRIYMGSTHYTFENNGSMIFLDLSYNHLDGQIPKELGNMYYLMIMNLGYNMLSGLIPPDLGNLRSLAVLYLSHNALEGPIPAVFSGLMLSDIDLSYNKLNGSIPDRGSLVTFPAYRYENNSGLCGFPLPSCGGSSDARAADHQKKSQRRQASIAGSIAMGLLFSLFCIVGIIIILVEHKKRQLNKDDTSSVRDVYIDSWSRSLTGNSNWKLTGTQTVINLATFEKPLKDLTLGDLIKATNGFHSDAKVGSGGFGDVFKAELEDGTVVAVKKLIHVSGQGHREFMAEMETIGRIKHRNLVPLLGYCRVGEERFLVYQYMKYGSLDDVLHNRKKGGIKLNWAARRTIALGAARGLAFLHHNCIPHIIHRDMKSSNVLLDENMEARVSDFGMARLVSVVDTHLSVSTLAGTPGYVPPEYYQSFRCTTKGDVYSFGVVLLELLTGKPPTGSLDFGDNNLVGWVKQHSRLRVVDVFDPELLKEDPTLELELLEHLRVACACLDDRPSKRPTMMKVMAMFKEIQTGSVVDTKAPGLAAVVDQSFHDDMSLKESNEEKA